MFKKTGMIELLCVSVFLLLLTAGCGGIVENVVENVVERVISSESGQEVDVDISSENGEVTISTEDQDVEIEHKTGSDMAWPGAIPPFVPQLNGNISAIIQAGDDEVNSYTIAYENLIDVDMDQHVKLLEDDHGWSVISRAIHEDGWTINATHDQHESFLMVLVHDNNEGVIQVTFGVD